MGIFSRSSRKDLYWHNSKLDLCCISINGIDLPDKDPVILSETQVVTFANFVIPGINKCAPNDVRYSLVKTYNEAYDNSGQALGDYIPAHQAIGELHIVTVEGIDLWFTLALIYKNEREKMLITKLEKAEQWAENFFIR